LIIGTKLAMKKHYAIKLKNSAGSVPVSSLDKLGMTQ